MSYIILKKPITVFGYVKGMYGLQHIGDAVVGTIIEVVPLEMHVATVAGRFSQERIPLMPCKLRTRRSDADHVFVPLPNPDDIELVKGQRNLAH